MRLLADENLSNKMIDYLIEKGHDVKAVGRAHPSIKDENIIAISNLENRVIVTFDSDFGRLIFQKGLYPEAGVIFLRLEAEQIKYAGELVEHLISVEKINPARRLYVYDGENLRNQSY